MVEQMLDRIYGEYQAYKARILGMSNAEIFGKSYEIDTIANLYAILGEMIPNLPADVLAFLLSRKNILVELYGQWLTKDDSGYKELEEYVAEELQKMKDNLVA